jgi:hypothetical protein
MAAILGREGMRRKGERLWTKKQEAKEAKEAKEAEEAARSNA